MYLLRPEVKIEFTCSYPIHVNIDTDDFDTHHYEAKSHIIGDEVLRTEVKVEIATDLSVLEAEQLLDKETEEFGDAAEALKKFILDSWPEGTGLKPELHSRKRRESEPFQIAQPILFEHVVEQVTVEKIVFASISFIYETKTTLLNETEEIEEPEKEERDIVSTANLLAQKTEEIVHEIVADSQKIPKSTGDSEIEITFTGIVVSAGVTTEIIGKTKITTKGDITAIGSWGKSFNLKLSGDVNGKFYMGVPISGLLSSMLRIPQLMFYIDTCKYSCGDDVGVNLIEGSCYASVLGVENINPNASKIVDEVSQFRFKSFSFTENAKATSCTIICSVNTCLEDNCAPPQCEGGLLGYN
ncbi:unnamed protein product [Oikopleura dioica]|uniref:ZP domain-containing protein n=1 Tax=Oikopleura dioica TaxID=34765 RepID=E4YBF5_OIKDI|nr:unnamed protein product [Oikopleura dioica]